jgi:hypothetical protein
MIPLDIARTYANRFRALASQKLRPGFAISVDLFITGLEGGIVVFRFEKDQLVQDHVNQTFPTIAAALSTIPQKAFGGNLRGFRFKGTNTVVEGDRIILIKSDDLKEWSLSAAEKDAAKILSAVHQGAAV